MKHFLRSLGIKAHDWVLLYMALTGAVLYAWSGNVVPTQFKVDLLTGVHNFTVTTGDVFKAALYDNTITPATSDTTYNTTGELATAGGYTQGGFTLTNVTPTASGTTALTDFSVDPNWTSATFTARGCKIYNSSKSNKLVAMLDFGADKPVSSGTFTVVFPVADASNAVIRIN